jgi:hypothetical protein
VGVFNYKDIYCEMKQLIRHILREHTREIGEQRENWPIDKLRSITLQYDNLKDFRKDNINAYNALKRKGLFDEFTSHMDKPNTYSDEDVENEAHKYDTIKDFREKSPNMYGIAKKRGLMPKFRKFLESKITNWTDAMIKKEAKKYQTLQDFYTNSPSAYKIAQYRDMLDKITSHMPRTRIWTYQEAREEALNYDTFAEFVNFSPAYNQSRRNGWLEKFQKFLKLNVSGGEKILSDILKKNKIQFFTQKKYTDCYHTSLKGNCTPLKFDIYVPKFDTLIEYDGIQHFIPVNYFGGEEGFKLIKKRDNIKNEYCEKNGIKLIRIPYTMKKEEIEPYILKELGIE